MSLVGLLLVLATAIGALGGASGTAVAADDVTFSQVSAGVYRSCGLITDGSIVCWGDTTAVPAGTYSQVSDGLYHTCGVTTAGSIVCWGGNGDGQTNVPAGTFSQVDAGGYHTCGVTTDESIVCWGATVMVSRTRQPGHTARSALGASTPAR